MKKSKENVWIYESPDGGKTVYKRPFGKSEPRIMINSENKKHKELLNQISKN